MAIPMKLAFDTRFWKMSAFLLWSWSYCRECCPASVLVGWQKLCGGGKRVHSDSGML